MSPRMAAALTQFLDLLRKYKAILLTLAVLALLTAMLLVIRGKPEPAYQKRSASDWLEVIRTNQLASAEVANAFTAMGPDGAVFLGEQLVQQPSKTYAWVMAHHQSIPLSLRKFVLKPQWQYRGDIIVMLLSAMGTNAAPAVPALLTWLESQPPGLPQVQTYLPSYFPPQAYIVRTVNTTTGSYKTNILLSSIISNQAILNPGAVPTPAWAVAQASVKTQIVVSAPGLVTTNVVTVLRTGTRPLSRYAFQVLIQNGSEDPRVIPLLLNPMNDVGLYRPPKFGANLKVAARNSLPLIIQSAESREFDRKMGALALLKTALPESAAAREYLIRALNSNDARIFDFAIGALQTTTQELDRIIPLAVQGLRQFRNRTTDLEGDWIPPVYPTLKAFAQHSPLVIPQVQAALDSVEPYEQVGILQLLRQIGTTNSVDLALLESYTTNHVIMVRAAAWLTLGKLKGDPLAIAVGRITFQDIGPHIIPEESYRLLEEKGAAARIAVPTLIHCLKYDHIGTLVRTVEALGKIGPAAQEALEPLRQLRKHPEQIVREAVEMSLRKITAE